MRGVRKRASTHGWVRAGRRGRLNRRPIDPARRRAERGGRSFVRRRRRRRRRHRPVAETRRGPNVEHPIGPTRSDPIQPPRDERARSTDDGWRSGDPERARARRRETPRLGRGSVLERARRRREEKNKRKPKTRVRRASARVVNRPRTRPGWRRAWRGTSSVFNRSCVDMSSETKTHIEAFVRPSVFSSVRPFPNRGVMNGEIVI